ncbi:MAG: restriction endonuclease subunit S [Alphaproteobacteria bacterium]|nr:restriction endonuclease subunit S [Alphaproteobacteria bacterium]
MNSWKSIKLSDVCYFSSDKIEVSNLSLDNYVSTENMLSNKSGICRAVNLPNTSLTVAFNFGDILLSNIRPYFKKIWLANFNGGCSNDVLVLKAKESIDAKFLYYILSDNKFFDYDTANAKGTKMPRGDKAAIMNYEFFLPPLDIQKKIAGVLGALDDKIELNNRINNNLEQQAQSLFKSWFVDFEPFGGTMPDDWKVGNLLDIADYLNGLAMQKFRPAENEKGLPVLKIKELRQGFCDSSSELCSLNVKNEYIVNDGDVIFSWSGSLLVDFWCCGKCGLNQHLFKVTSKNFDKWFYYLWTKHYLEHFAFIAADKATTMGHIKREELEKAKVVIPSSDCYQKMNQIMTPIYDLLISNRIENNRLIQLRDALLPKLMSGEIDVSKVDISGLFSADKLSFTEE